MNERNDLQTVVTWANAYIAHHPVPDFHIGPADDHQLQRWFILPRNAGINCYLHRFLRDDDARALHDHPWDNRTLILEGGYIEHLEGGETVTRFVGDTIERRASTPHRVELIDGPAITLFTTGPVIREWGFHCPAGWRHWKEFVTEVHSGNIAGRGCE